MLFRMKKDKNVHDLEKLRKIYVGTNENELKQTHAIFFCYEIVLILIVVSS